MNLLQSYPPRSEREHRIAAWTKRVWSTGMIVAPALFALFAAVFSGFEVPRSPGDGGGVFLELVVAFFILIVPVVVLVFRTRGSVTLERDELVRVLGKSTVVSFVATAVFAVAFPDQMIDTVGSAYTGLVLSMTALRSTYVKNGLFEFVSGLAFLSLVVGAAVVLDPIGTARMVVVVASVSLVCVWPLAALLLTGVAVAWNVFLFQFTNLWNAATVRAILKNKTTRAVLLVFASSVGTLALIWSVFALFR